MVQPKQAQFPAPIFPAPLKGVKVPRLLLKMVKEVIISVNVPGTTVEVPGPAEVWALQPVYVC